MKKTWSIYTMEHYSGIKNDEIMSSAATCVDLGIVILSEVRQREQILYDITDMWNFLLKRYNLIKKQKQVYRLRERTYGYGSGGNMGERIVREFGTDIYTLLYLKWRTSKDQLDSTENSAQHYVTT